MRRGNVLPELHEISLGQDTLHRPSRQLARVVLHLGGHDGTALRHELATPVESAAAALRLVVELVECVHGQELVVAVDGVLLDGVELRPHDQVHGVLLVGRQVELAVLVHLGCRRFRLLGGVVEGVVVGHLDLLRLALQHDLVGEVVVDVGSFLSERCGLVDALLGALGRLEGRIGGVLVDGHHVQRGVVALVQEHLVALLDDDDVPGVDGARRAHEHGQHAVGREDGGLVLVGELLDDGVGGGADVVRGAVDQVELLLGGLDGLLVVGAVVVVQETIRLDILAVVRIKVQLAQTVEVDLLQQLPVGTDVDGRVAVALRLVPVLPAEATATATAATALVLAATATTIVATALATAVELLAAPACVLAGTAALATAAAGEDGATAETGLCRVANVGDDRERGFVLLDCGGSEDGGALGTVGLLVWLERSSVSDLR